MDISNREGKLLGKFEVELEADPTFNARKIKD